MKSLILYVSKTGCTEKCATYLNEKNVTDIFRLHSFKGELQDYESIVFMSPVYMGKVNRDILELMNKNLELLKEKSVYIVLCGMNMEGFDAMVEHNFSEDILRFSEVVYGGGAYYLNKMNFFQKRIVKSVAHVKESSEHIKYENLDKIKI